LSPERCQKRPDINGVLARLLCEGVALRGCARAAAIPHAVVNAKKRAKLTGGFYPMFSVNHT